jgi:diacylglycerol O-acyltransferase 2, plant
MGKGVVTFDRSKATRGVSCYLAMWVWVGWITFYCAFILSLPLLFMYAKVLLSIIVGLMILSAVTTIDPKKQPAWGYAIGRWAMEGAADYFRIKIVVEDPEAVEKSGVAIFAIEPHDVLPLSIFVFNDCFEGIKGHNCYGCLTSACFNIPLMRHVYTWVNAHSIDKANIQRMLAKKISPVLCPGGVQEVTLMENEDECVLFLNGRRGFVKLAMVHGTALIPVFSFGLRKMFTFWVPRSKFVQKIARKIGFLPMLFFGMWGVPFGPAKPCDIVNVVGKPIKVPHIENPSDEEIAAQHVIFVKAMEQLYEDHKDEYGMGHIKLRIA